MTPHDQALAAEQYVPSPSQRVRDQVARYEATDGREGGTLEGRPVVILTMTGATSGKIRKTPIMRVERDGTYVAVALCRRRAEPPGLVPQSARQPRRAPAGRGSGALPAGARGLR